MTVWEALALGVVQGLGEFLPISSSGHLILLEKLGVGSQSLLFNIVVHLGTLLALVIVMRKSVWSVIRRPFQKKTLYILLACLPTFALALIFKYALPSLLEGELLGFGFTLTACMLFASEKLRSGKPRLLNAAPSLICGVAQGIAVLPGVSRSGATVSALCLLGVDRAEAADFSFLLSIPVILGSAALEGADVLRGYAFLDVPPLALAVGAIAAFVAGIFSIKLFLKLIKDRSLLPFAVYTLLLGFVVTLLPLFGVNV